MPVPKFVKTAVEFGSLFKDSPILIEIWSVSLRLHSVMSKRIDYQNRETGGRLTI